MDTQAVSILQPQGGPRHTESRPCILGMRRSCDRCGHHKKRCDGERPCRRCVGSGSECTYSKRRPSHTQPQQQRQQLQAQRTKVLLLPSTFGADSLKIGEDCTGTAAAPKPAQRHGGPTCMSDTVDQNAGRSPMPGMRRSCDRCGKFKKRCGGEWPCRRCLDSGNECTYSKRRSPNSQHHQYHQQTRPAGVQSTKALPLSMSGRTFGHGMVSFKRCRLSASPATGLVGLQENLFLSDFFTCVGFLPLATQSLVREAIVKMLALPASVQPAHAPHDRYESLDETEPEDSLASPVRGRQFPKDLSTCVFWCAVALGALVGGNPIDSVANYCQLARDALETYSGPANIEVARAWTILAHVYIFCGNPAMFQEYIALSEAFVSASIEQGLMETLPVGLPEIVHYRNAIKVSCGDIDEELESLIAQDYVRPHLGKALTQSELYTFLVKWWRTLEKNVYFSEYVEGGSSSEVKPGEQAAEVEIPMYGTSAEVLETMTARLRECESDFRRLEETVDREDFRDGIGGIMVNGTLLFEKALKSDFPGALERLSRNVEVFKNFPGLCRFEMMVHAAHVALTALAAMDDPRAKALYNTLRTTYNLMRLPGVAAFPPLEEWQGISHYCGLGYCRAMERVILSGEMNVFSTRTDTSGIERQDTRTNGAIPDHGGVDGRANGRSSTDESSKDSLAWAPTPTSASVIPGSDLFDPCKGHSGSCLPLDGGAEWRTAPPTLRPSFPLVPNGELQVVLNADIGGGGVEEFDGRPRGYTLAQQIPGALLTAPEFCSWGGETAGTRCKGELQEEDWLELAHVLFDSFSDA